MFATLGYCGEVWIDGQTNEGHIIQEEGTTITQDPVMDFVGAAVTVSRVDGETQVSVDAAETIAFDDLSDMPGGDISVGDILLQDNGWIGAGSEAHLLQFKVATEEVYVPVLLNVAGKITATTIETTDDSVNAFLINTSTLNYLTIDTSLTNEYMSFGNTTTNPVYTFYGTGLTTFGGNIKLPDAGDIGSATTADLITLQATSVNVNGQLYVDSTLTVNGNGSEMGDTEISTLSTNAIFTSLGAVATPSHSFTGDVDTGMWSSGANIINFSTAGTERLEIEADGDFNFAANDLTTTGAGTFGDVTVDTRAIDSAAEFILNKPSTRVGHIKFLESDVIHWVQRHQNSAVGNDLNFRRHNAAGTFVDIPLSLDWTAGGVTIANTAYLGLIDLGTNTIDDLGMTGAWDMNNGAMTNVNIDTGNIATAVINSEWDAAYTHSIDNTQAHSDYLLNSGDDSTSGKITATGFNLATPNSLKYTGATTGYTTEIKGIDSIFCLSGSVAIGAYGADYNLNVKANMTMDQSVATTNSPSFRALTITGASGITASIFHGTGLDGNNGTPGDAGDAPSNTYVLGDGGTAYGFGRGGDGGGFAVTLGDGGSGPGGSGANGQFKVSDIGGTLLSLDDFNALLTVPLYFTQTDGNEKIDSLADGYMDYDATTGHRFLTAPVTIANNTASTTGATGALIVTGGVGIGGRLSAANGASLGDGASTNTVDISSGGITIFRGTAGLHLGSCSMYEGGWSQASAVQNTWYNISDADFIDGQLIGVTHDGSGKLTTDQAGRYLCNASLDWENDTVNDHIEIGFEINGSGSAATEGIVCNETKFANEEHMGGTTAILDMGAGETLEFCIRTTDNNTPTILVRCVNLNMIQIAGT